MWPFNRKDKGDSSPKQSSRPSRLRSFIAYSVWILLIGAGGISGQWVGEAWSSNPLNQWKNFSKMFFTGAGSVLGFLIGAFIMRRLRIGTYGAVVNADGSVSVDTTEYKLRISELESSVEMLKNKFNAKSAEADQLQENNRSKDSRISEVTAERDRLNKEIGKLMRLLEAAKNVGVDGVTAITNDDGQIVGFTITHEGGSVNKMLADLVAEIRTTATTGINIPTVVAVHHTGSHWNLNVDGQRANATSRPREVMEDIAKKISDRATKLASHFSGDQEAFNRAFQFLVQASTATGEVPNTKTAIDAAAMEPTEG